MTADLCCLEEIPRIWRLFAVLVLLPSLHNNALADPVVVHHREGVTHGFLVLSSVDGKTVASGDLIQVVKGDQVTSEIVFHFKDGSLHDETAVFSQEHVFRLISDHLVQTGPSFPHPIDISLDVAGKTVTIHANQKAKEKDSTQHVDFPEDIANGMILILLRNISPSVVGTKVSMLSTSAKPRLVKLLIAGKGERGFSFAGADRKATDFAIKVEIGGVAGAIAPLIGKQPPGAHIWMSTGPSPTFVQSEGPLYEGGPIWRTNLAPLQVMDHDLESASEHQQK